MCIIQRNYVGPRGEIDIIARDGSVLCFVEVKTRRRSVKSRPADSVTSEKKKRIIRTAKRYLAQLGNPSIIYRFDIVEIIFSGPRTYRSPILAERIFFFRLGSIDLGEYPFSTKFTHFPRVGSESDRRKSMTAFSLMTYPTKKNNLSILNPSLLHLSPMLNHKILRIGLLFMRFSQSHRKNLQQI